MSLILQGLEGVVCQMDDVLVFGRDQVENDTRLTAALQRIEAAGAILNAEKCEFGKQRLKFLGHINNGNGITADPDKTSSIREMQTLTSVPELRRLPYGRVQDLRRRLVIWTRGSPPAEVYCKLDTSCIRLSITVLDRTALCANRE